jgi:hypothetical protein
VNKAGVKEIARKVVGEQLRIQRHRIQTCKRLHWTTVCLSKNGNLKEGREHKWVEWVTGRGSGEGKQESGITDGLRGFGAIGMCGKDRSDLVTYGRWVNDVMGGE